MLGRIIPDKQPTFSVIDGAQTITASARYFFEMEFKLKDSVDISVKERLKKKLEDSKKAQVLVRVIHIPEFDKFTSRNYCFYNSICRKIGCLLGKRNERGKG